ncbi:MAG: hypothetical protein K5751_06665, partial [Treponemataceae bacterium]|nr:hypothetical protein [Treponemataceae bacterium]
MQKKEDGDADYKTVMQTSYTINHALTETDVTTPLTLELKPLMTENGTGKIELSFSSSPTGLYDNVSVEIGNVTQRTAWDDAVLVGTSGISMKTGQDGEPCKMPSGVYSVTLTFFRNGALVYATTQEINVFDDMTTSRWVDGSTQNTPISNGSFVLTESDINRFKYTNYFVASSTSSPAGDNGNSGSPYAPLATVSEALRRIAETGTASDEYTIWLMSDITDIVTMSGSGTGGLDGKASSITIRPWQNSSATLSGASGAGSSVINVSTTVPVTLENLTITGGSSSGNGGGICIGSGAEVT